MKNLLLAILAMIATIGNSQETEALDTFIAVESFIGANINIVKANDHTLSLTGDKVIIDQISWEVDDKTLKLKSANDQIDLSTVVITLSTPEINHLSLSRGGTAKLAVDFSRMDNFEVSASNNAKIDLSNIEFKTLVATSTDGGEIIFKKTTTTDNPSEAGSKVKSIQ